METELSVKLLRHTPEPEKAVATAARLCYYKSSIPELNNEMTPEKCQTLITKLLEMGHESPFEHASFTFGIEGVSRALTHQLVRHRIASYTQQSQRYVDGSDFNYIVPPKIKENDDLHQLFIETMKQLGEKYDELKTIAPKEDARFILPNAAETKIIVTMNARSLFNFFKLRSEEHAQWEIRALAKEMLRLCKDAAPAIFNGV